MTVSYITPTTTPYTLTNGIPKAGVPTFTVRVVDELTLVRFESNTTDVTVVKSTQTDYNPNSKYYNITIPLNAAATARNVKVYGYSIIGQSNTKYSGTLLLDVYQSGV